MAKLAAVVAAAVVPEMPVATLSRLFCSLLDLPQQRRSYFLAGYDKTEENHGIPWNSSGK